MRTTIYLLHHGATEASLARPPRLQGRRQDAPLARAGVRQAEATRDFLAVRPIDHCYCSPLRCAVETATIVASPHGLTPQSVEALAECDLGRWDGLDWQTIRRLDAEAYAHFLDQPGAGYPEGETFSAVCGRVAAALENIFTQHAGQSILVVGHHVVNRVYLAGLMGLSPAQARQVRQDACGISLIVRQEDETTVSTVNAAFHLQGMAA